MKTTFFYLIVISLLVVSCSKDNDSGDIQEQTFEVNATASTEWKYFSFESNDTVEVADPMNSNSWDLAFQRYRIRTNGGKSGNGMGGAANSHETEQEGFDALKVVSDTLTFRADDEIEIAVQQGYTTYILNPVLYTWFGMEFGTMGTQIVPTDSIYVVKTALGKYAKIWVKSYYNAEDNSGYITFQYKYQPDGSRNLE